MSFPELQKSPLAPHRAAITDDDHAILRFAFDAPEDAVLVTLVEVRGGAARAVGAQMAVRKDGSYCGYISGGCTEAAVAAEALVTLERGTDRFLKLGEGSPFFDIVLPCGGGITLSLHVLRDRAPLAKVFEGIEARRPASLAYDPGRQLLEISGGGEETGRQGEMFVRAYRPRARLAVAGKGIEAETTRSLALAAGYEVVELGEVRLDSDTAVVLLLHDLDQELPLLEAALAQKPRYIGALGSRTTHERRCQALRDRGYEEADIARVKGPIGLFGPARDASTLAISILAELASDAF